MWQARLLVVSGAIGLLDAVDAAAVSCGELLDAVGAVDAMAGAALGDSWLSGGLLDAVHAVDATAVLRGRRGTW